LISPEAHQLFIDLQLLPHGSTTSWNPTGTIKPGTRAPSGESRPWHDEFLDDYRRHGHRAITYWRGELKRIRGHGRIRIIGESIADEDRRIAREGIGWMIEDVARKFRCTPTRVRRACLTHGVTINNGILARATASEGVGRARQALAFADEGLTQQQIATLMGTSQPTIHRLLKMARIDRP